MLFKKFGKLLCAVTLCGVALSVPLTASGCKGKKKEETSDHPEAKIVIEYDGEEYELEYTLYRNMYPQTVQHFIELADEGFYNNTIVHDVNSDGRIYCGGYNFGTDDEKDSEEKDIIANYKAAVSAEGTTLTEYITSISKEHEYYVLADPANGKITPSVYSQYIDGEYLQPLRTLIGEFKDNQHKIANGALTRSFGCLTMFYSKKDDSKEREAFGIDKSCWLDKKGSEDGFKGEYERNSATSIFGIQYSTAETASNNYCIFAKLKDTDSLTDLKEAANIESSTSRTTTKSFYVDNWDEVVGSNSTETTYRIPKTPIIIKSVEITKY